MIDKQKLVEMFEGMRTEAKWDTDSDLLWGYFFTSESISPLEKLADHLSSAGYKLVQIRPDEEDPFYWLHMERVETHSPDTLYVHNEQLEEIAVKFGVTYDGMDAGPVHASD